jgi:hypothetical protein
VWLSLSPHPTWFSLSAEATAVRIMEGLVYVTRFQEELATSLIKGIMVPT